MGWGISVGISTKLLVILFLLNSLGWNQVSGNLVFAGCDKNGWKCISSKVKTDKYDLEYDCNGTSSTIISLWSFRAPKEIFGLKISNCGYLEVDLSCGNDGQPIDSLYIYNVEQLNLSSPVHPELSLLPNKLVLDTIGRIDRLHTNLFKQKIDFPVQLFKCSILGSPINTVFFTDIGQIDVIEHHAINLTEMSWFAWNNVTINEIEPMAMQVFMQKDKQFTIKQSQVNKIGYQGMQLRAHSIFFNETDIHDIEKHGISATVYWLDFTNSKIGTVHPRGFHLLAQNVNFMNNSFAQLETKAFDGIGPGLLENALVSFGRLKFTYVFSRNRILQANVGSLNPDWEAYKNVRTFLNFTLNHLPCSCSEFGWVNLDDGLGSGLSDTVSFSTRIMEKKSQNMCIDSPCLLPLGVMSIMQFINGSCQKASGLKEVCNKFINNKEFRTYILSESDKYTRNRATHLNHGIVNMDDALISDHPFPIVPVKNNALEKKTEYLNFWEGEPKLHGMDLHRVKRRSPPQQNETVSTLKRHKTQHIKKVETKDNPEENTETTEEMNKTKNVQLGAYKVDWKLVVKNSNKDIVYVPKIIANPEETIEYVKTRTGSTDDIIDEEISDEENIPITIRPYGRKKEYSRDKGQASIHEQISNIAEKLTKDIEQQVQERQMLEQEQEKLQQLNNAKTQEKILHDLESSKKRLGAPQVKSTTARTKRLKKIKNKNRTTTKTKSTTATTTSSTVPSIKWDTFEGNENNDGSMYIELMEEKQKLQTDYDNQTFPVQLMGRRKF